ncbi:Flp pilus assembly protein CpaB [Stenotrophomonas maltophilia]|uniref:Flp pilus assembly protein CpaB n=1 Tax=Stenotrophomonas TaxID=40323 RepID=UPI00130FBA57|nr:Flp pilus assembly protein CpaB [Stenotrophomonas maltophilia]MBA0225552.1 Flp pilus assembly protein CpaB [Stenotrophomonas maltophilia]MBA0367332.1 Flp pilus assembly protein CpaB [Stenotrophomonas maltophilia]MBA0404403.1 Flp pilus assembly protein CpaB [Stenotrophomonas maltophilia]
MLKLTRIAAVALIGLAVLLALIAFMIGRKPAEPATVAPVAHNETQAITVVEAVARLPAGEPISANGLRLAQRTSPVPGAATSIAAVTGKVPVQDIAEGSVINGSALAQGFSLQLRPGERALAVPVDELVGAGNRILPGDFVDVFLNLRNAQPNINSPGEAAQTRLLLSRLRVLSYGQQDIVPVATETTSDSEADTRNDPRAADITGSGSTHSSSNEAPQPARSAVLAVPVADANRLLLGAQQGKLFLALRNPADTGLPDLALFPQSRGVIDPLRGLDAEQQLALQRPENHAFAGIDSDALAGRGSAPQRGTPASPSRAPAPRRSAPRASGIEIIRGDSSASRASL